MNPRIVWSLLIARNKEFYRDKGSVTWAILFPLLVMTGISFAFKNQDQELFKVGIIGEKIQVESLAFTQNKWVTVVRYAETDRFKAMERIRHHQLDLLLQADDNHPDQFRYWTNTDSSRSDAAEQLLLKESSGFVRETVSGRAIRYVDWVIPGILGMNIMFGALFGIGYVIVRYRKMEVLKRIQATPVTALEYLTAQVASRLLIMMIISALIFTGCNMALNFTVEGSYLLLFVIALLGGFSMITLGLVMASRTDSEELAGGLLNFATFPMMFLSEVWFSLDGAPDWMTTLSKAMPLTHLVAAARKVMLEGAGLADIGLHLSILVCMSVICLILASLLFRWSKN